MITEWDRGLYSGAVNRRLDAIVERLKDTEAEQKDLDAEGKAQADVIGQKLKDLEAERAALIAESAVMLAQPQ